MKRWVIAATAGFLIALSWLPPARAQAGVTGTIWSASEVLDALQAIPFRSIPPALVRDAQGVAIIPGVIKVGLGLGGRYGEGLILGRQPDGTWGTPVFITLTGGSLGWQIGVQSTDIVLVFKSRKSLDQILQGTRRLTLGADVAVAAGPVGRQAEASTDVRLEAEIYSYSRSRGLFVGLALEGAVITNLGGANAAFAQRPRAEDLAGVDRIKAQLAVMSGVPGVVVRPLAAAPPAYIPPPPPVAPAPGYGVAPPAITSPPPVYVQPPVPQTPPPPVQWTPQAPAPQAAPPATR